VVSVSLALAFPVLVPLTVARGSVSVAFAVSLLFTVRFPGFPRRSSATPLPLFLQVGVVGVDFGP
jgi:hypothetical protein